MTTETISATEAARHFSEYLNRVIYKGESFVITRGNRPVAELRGSSRQPMTSDELAAMVEALPRLPEDDVEAFAADVESARASADTGLPKSPWES